jgi:hypothetical protein
MLAERARRAGWVIADPVLDVPTVCRRRLEALALGWRRARWNLAAAGRDRAWSMRPTRRRSIGLRSTLLTISAGSRRAAWLVADAILDVPAACRKRFQPVAAASQRARANAVEAAHVVGWSVADSVAWMDARRGRIAGFASVPLVSALALVIGLSSGPADSSPLVGPPAVVQDASPAPAAVPAQRSLAAPRRTQVVRHATAPRQGLGRSSVAAGAKSLGATSPAANLGARSPRAASAPVAHRAGGARPASRPKAATPVATPRPRRTPPPRPRATPPAAPARPTPAAPAATPVAVPAGLPTAGQQPPAQQPAQPAADQTRQPSQAQPSTPTPPAPSNEGTGPVTTPPPSSGHADEEDNRWGQRWNQNESRGDDDDRDRDGDRDRDRDRSDRRRDGRGG